MTDEIINLVPVLPYKFVDVYLKEDQRFHWDTLKVALAQLILKAAFTQHWHNKVI